MSQQESDQIDQETEELFHELTGNQWEATELVAEGGAL